MSRLAAYVQLMRPHQYYKNTLIFIGIVFGEKLGQFDLYLPLLIGFFLLCSMSSTSYIINDIRDLEKDRLHPEKATRPLSSGAISPIAAFAFACLLFIVSFVGALIIDIIYLEREVPTFALSLLAIFVTSQAYNLGLKDIAFADVSAIALNYVFRAVSGCYLVEVAVSPWLIIIGYLFALFLALCKRKGDLLYLGTERAMKHKPVFKAYSAELLNQTISIVASSLIFSYAIFTFIDADLENKTLGVSSRAGIMIATIPLVTFAVFRYLYLLNSEGKIARKAEMIFFDRQLLMAGVIVLILLVISTYQPDWLELFSPLPRKD
ncbi:MAG: UbiA prenyltransferase family protein [Candidatus Heimdallarchaeota archaeon]